MDVLELIKQQVESNPVVIYMKGTPEMPRCGFSQRAARALAATGLPFAYVNVMEDPEIFDNLSEEMAHVGFANPQAYVRYLQHYPEQKELILHSTRWNPVNVPKLRQKFEPVPGGAEVAEFLSLRFPANSTPKQK